MIKTAIIIERADIALGGAERSVLELACQLPLSDVKVTILAAKGQTKAKNIKVLCHSGHKRTYLAVFEKALMAHLTQNRYDIIHSTLPFDFADVYQPRGGSYPEAIIRNAASHENRLISSYKLITHYANLRRSALLRAERQLCRRSEHTIVAAISEYVKRQFEQHYGLHSKRIVVIPSGIKVNRHIHTDKTAELRRQVFAALDITETARPAKFLFAANNFRLKGLSALIRTLALTTNRKTPRPVYIVAAGAGSSRKYRHLAKKLGVSNKIVFLGRLRHIQNALSISDAAVLPTWYDPCSRFILEALAAAKPVITTRCNGAAEAFVNNRHGRTIDSPNDTEALADAMCFYADPANAKLASEAIIEDNLSERVSIQNHTKRMVELYESILNKTGRRPPQQKIVNQETADK
jgi:UDP-glucose:(heptosyl)LPS alpha-1,3-glucosyltransferase